MNNKDLPDLNQPGGKTAEYSGMESPLAREEAAQSGGSQDTKAAEENAEGDSAGGSMEHEISALKQALENK